VVRQHSPSESRPSTVSHISPPDCSRHSEPMDPILSRNLAYGIVALPEFLPRMHACQLQAVPHAFVSDLSELNVKSYDPVSPNGAFQLKVCAGPCCVGRWLCFWVYWVWMETCVFNDATNKPRKLVIQMWVWMLAFSGNSYLRILRWAWCDVIEISAYDRLCPTLVPRVFVGRPSLRTDWSTSGIL